VTNLTPRRRLICGLGCIAMAVFCGILDGVRITQACQQIGRPARWDLLWGGLVAVATVTLIVRSTRTDIWERSGLSARTFRWVVGLWLVVVCVGFVVTHPRDGSNDITSSVMVGIATCAGALFIAVFLWGGLLLLRPKVRGTPAALNTSIAAWPGGLSHQYTVTHSQHHAEVWHVDVSRDDPDYFIAHCDCDWVGTAHDATEPNAGESARQEANAHAANVAPLVVEI
jgi:hypothetical protein